MSEFNKYSTDGGATFIDVEDSEAVHYGEQSKGYVGKNLFKNTAPTATVSSVTFTHNSDDSVGLNNTASATAIYNVGSVKELSGINQNVILSGCPSGGSTSTYSLQIQTLTSANVIQNGTWLIDNGNGVTFNPSGPLVDTNGNSVSISDLYINIRIGSGEVTTGKTFYPMIRLASIPDNTYEPHLPPNTDLMSYADNAIVGVHNFLDSFATSSGNFTVNSDKSILVNGTFTTRTVFYLRTKESNFAPKVGQYKLYLAENTTKLKIVVDGYNGLNWYKSIGFTYTNTDITIDYNGYDRVVVYIVADTSDLPITVNNITLYPQIMLASDTYMGYTPYAMTNKELTDLTLKEKTETISISDNNLKEYTFSNVNKIISAQFKYNDDLFYTLNTDQAFPVITLEDYAGKIIITLNKKVTRTLKVKIFYY